MRYYIYDCNNQIFGNPAGYLRYQDAQGICTRYRYKLWSRYDYVLYSLDPKNKAHMHVWNIVLK